jgi:3-O-methylgallate 3,4-dioxygenase
MAEIVLGIGTSHTPMLSIPGEFWESYAERDHLNRELVFPPDGLSMSFATAVESYVPRVIQERVGNETSYKEQFARCQLALDTLRDSLAAAKPDITIIISDDQDEWFFENNMPAFSIFWGSSIPIKPRVFPPDAPAFMKYVVEGYGAGPLDVPVPSRFGRHVIEHLMDHDFDVSHVAYTEDLYGGRIKRRYPTPDGELDIERATTPRAVGLPHGFSFIVKRLFDSRPSPILPVFQNTCYPPNQVRPSRAYDFGKAIASAISAWAEDARVAVIGSGGLSHFVVDEEFDRSLLDALKKKDEDALRNLPRHRLYSATSESLNWVTAGGALADTSLNAEVLDYVPAYRSEAGTGGGWAFVRWQ